MRTKKAIGRSITERLCHGFRVSALFTLFLASFYCGEAFAIEFLTRDDFNARKSAYRDYPVNILFKKLPESNAQETREIRNLIILYQVFDPSMQDMEKAGLIQHQKFFGIIKRISGDSMEFWDAETDATLDFHVGIDLIPMENKKGYKVTKSGISKYAAIVYAVDNRLYKVEISFRPVEPTNLRVERGKKSTNIVSWIKPPTDVIPDGYTLYINGKPFRTVTSTSAKVPREKGRADRYFVRAIYKHGQKTISSVPSEEVVDDITAGEIERIAYARREFDLVLSGLTPSRWEDSRDLLYDNEQLFFEHLEGDSKTHAMDLIAFFRDIDAGDRLIGKTDIRKQDIDGAEKHYVNAEKKAKTLPPSMAVMFLVRMKTHAVSEKRAAIERDRQMRLAAQDFDKILADLTPSGWENAKKQLYRNEVVFKEDLEGQRKTDALNLIQFFRDIEEGDRILGQKGATRRDVDIASEMFNRAGDVAKLLPANVNVQFILTARTREISEMNRRLDRKQQTALAESSFEDVISGLTVSNWEASREMLYANEGLFSEYLAGKPQRDARNLVEFFRRIDDGDRIAQKTDATVLELDGAMALYDNAGKTAKQLSGGIEVQFIVILKKSAVALKKDELQRRQHRLAANQMFDNALADLTPDNWKQSRDQLYANETVLSENLEGIRKTDALILIAYFRSIDKGDRTITTRGHTLEGLEAAVTHYTAAGEIAKGLSSTVDVDFLTSQKLASGATRTAQLQTTERQDIANERFNDALANLTPKKWEQSREILYANETLFSEHLSGNRKTDALTLIALFQAIDAGDRTIETRGQTLEGVEVAMTHYTAADDLARQLSSAVDVRFLTTRKLTAGTTLTANLKTAKASDIANDRFDNVLADLTPGKWEQSRDLLYANETFFSEHLSGNRKTDAVILIAYFRSIDEGDRTMAARGNTVEGVAAAMTHYTAAGEKAKGLSSAANVRFLTALKLDAGAALRAELQQGEQRRVADATFAEVLAALRPETWQQSRDLLYANEQMLSEHLDSTKERDALTLIRFFRDIDEGDRQLVSGSPSIAELEAALRFYRRAEVMAELMQHRVDALFVPRQRIEQTSDQLTQLRAAERERIAAERIAAAQAAAQIPRTTPASTPTATARPASVPQKIYPPKTELKLAMSSFNKQSYDSSLIHFSHVYKDEIDQIKGKGKTRLLGVMALPSSHRAEVLFLLYYDRLKKTYNDEERAKDGLARLNSKVENGAGLWAIVSDQKRRKITRHINVYVSE